MLERYLHQKYNQHDRNPEVEIVDTEEAAANEGGLNFDQDY